MGGTRNKDCVSKELKPLCPLANLDRALGDVLVISANSGNPRYCRCVFVFHWRCAIPPLRFVQGDGLRPFEPRLLAKLVLVLGLEGMRGCAAVGIRWDSLLCSE